MRVALEVFSRIRNTYPVQQTYCAGQLVLRRKIIPVLNLRHLPADGHDRVQAGHWILEHHRDVDTAQRSHGISIKRQQVLLLEQDGSAVNLSVRRQ